VARSTRGLAAWLDERYNLKPFTEFLQHKEVPLGVHSMFWYFLGGTTLFFFTVQIATGVLLLMYYHPGEQTSYESIRYLTTKVPFGWLMRSVHCWSAHLMIISLVLHMFSTMMFTRFPHDLAEPAGVLRADVVALLGDNDLVSHPPANCHAPVLWYVNKKPHSPAIMDGISAPFLGNLADRKK